MAEARNAWPAAHASTMRAAVAGSPSEGHKRLSVGSYMRSRSRQMTSAASRAVRDTLRSPTYSGGRLSQVMTCAQSSMASRSAALYRGGAAAAEASAEASASAEAEASSRSAGAAASAAVPRSCDGTTPDEPALGSSSPSGPASNSCLEAASLASSLAGGKEPMAAAVAEAARPGRRLASPASVSESPPPLLSSGRAPPWLLNPGPSGSCVVLLSIGR